MEQFINEHVLCNISMVELKVAVTQLIFIILAHSFLISGS